MPKAGTTETAAVPTPVVARPKYRFFLSYASKSDDIRLRRFYNDLTDRVWALTGGERDDISFLADQTVRNGEHWQDVMIQALENSQVIVFLVSVFYIESAYCGRELNIFLEREEEFRRRKGDTDHVFLQPIIWTPVIRDLPIALKGIQWRDKDFPEKIAQRGLLTYMGESDQTPYARLIESLATSIYMTGVGDPLTPTGKYAKVDQIRNAFEERAAALLPSPPPEEAAPRMKCIYAVARQSEISSVRTSAASYSDAGGWFWRPYGDSTMVGPLLQRFITDFFYDRVEIPFDAGGNGDQQAVEARVRQIVDVLKQAALEDEIVLLVVDAWSAFILHYKMFLEKFDIEVPYNNAILIPWNESDPETAARSDDLQSAVRALFWAKSKLADYFKPRVGSVREFEEVLPDLLKTMRRMIDAHRAERRRVIEPTRPAPPIVRTSGSYV
jgi:FxsC-like protein